MRLVLRQTRAAGSGVLPLPKPIQRTRSLKEASRQKEHRNVQIDCSRRLRFGGHFGGSDDARANSTTGQRGHASSLGLRSRSNTSSWCLRGQNHYPSDPQSGPAMCMVAWRCLPSLALNLVVEAKRPPPKGRAKAAFFLARPILFGLAPHSRRFRVSCSVAARKHTMHC
jgi:hypothetical protein